MTDSKKVRYNKGDPIKCDCNRVVAFVKDGKIYAKCMNCKKWISVLTIKKD